MTSKHVINDFQAWNDGRLSEKKRPAIEKHLAECADCRAYFDKMSMLLGRMHPDSLPRLQPDPFLPARIRAISAGVEESAADLRKPLARPGHRRPFGWAGLSAMGVMMIAALWVGAYFGERLSSLSMVSSQTEETDIINSFYNEFSPSGFAGDWETILTNYEEDSNET